MLTIKQIIDTAPTYEKVKYNITQYGTERIARISNEGESIFIYARGKQRYGNRFYTDSDLQDKQIVILSKVKTISPQAKWRKSWKRTLSYMEQSGLWKDLQKEIRWGLLLGYDKVQQLKQIDNTDYVSGYTENNKIQMEKMKEIVGDEDFTTFLYWNMTSPAKIKKVRYHTKSWHKEDTERIIKATDEAIKNKKPYHASGQNGYDVSLEYNPKSNKAWYSEEYKGCGNGHYYLLVNKDHALFYNND